MSAPPCPHCSAASFVCVSVVFLTCYTPARITSTPPPQAHLDSLSSCFSSFSSTPLPRAHLKINTPTSSRSPDALWVFSSRCFTVAELADIDMWFSVYKAPYSIFCVTLLWKKVCFMQPSTSIFTCRYFEFVLSRKQARRDLFVYLLHEEEEAHFSVVSPIRTFYTPK